MQAKCSSVQTKSLPRDDADDKEVSWYFVGGGSLFAIAHGVEDAEEAEEVAEEVAEETGANDEAKELDTEDASSSGSSTNYHPDGDDDIDRNNSDSSSEAEEYFELSQLTI